MPAGVDGCTDVPSSVSLDDFMTGLIAGLAAEGIEAVSIRGRGFYAAVEVAFQTFESISEAQGIRLKFWITRDPVYGDSDDIREGLTRVVQRDLASFDDPFCMNMRLLVGVRDSAAYLDTLPGGAQAYREATRGFLEKFRA